LKLLALEVERVVRQPDHFERLIDKLSFCPAHFLPLIFLIT